MIFPTNVEGQVRNNGYYDAVPYRFWSYKKVSRNIFEDKQIRAPSQRLRIQEPRLLCFPKLRTDDNPTGKSTVVDYRSRSEQAGSSHETSPTRLPNTIKPSATPIRYIFISYMGGNQFSRVCPHALKAIEMDDGKWLCGEGEGCKLHPSAGF